MDVERIPTNVAPIFLFSESEIATTQHLLGELIAMQLDQISSHPLYSSYEQNLKNFMKYMTRYFCCCYYDANFILVFATIGWIFKVTEPFLGATVYLKLKIKTIKQHKADIFHLFVRCTLQCFQFSEGTNQLGMRKSLFMESRDIFRTLSNLTLSWRRLLSYRNQSIDLRCKSKDWFLSDNGLRHERVNSFQPLTIFTKKFLLRCLAGFWIRLLKGNEPFNL